VVDAHKSQGEYVTVVNQTVLVYYFALTTRPTLLQLFPMNGFRDVNGLRICHRRVVASWFLQLNSTN